MKGISHMLMGASAGAVLSVAVTGHMDPVTVSASGIGALLPDLDHPRSKLGRKVLPVSLILWLVIGHRGMSHSLVAWGIIGTLAAVASIYAPALALPLSGLALGYGVHLLGDSMTYTGIPLMWPSQKRYHIAGGLFATGSVMEYAILLGWLALCAFAIHIF